MGLRRRGDALIPALRRLSPAWVVITIALVLELGGGTHAKSMEVAKISGRISLVGVLTGFDGQINPLAILRKSLVVNGIYVGSRDMQEQFHRALDANNIHSVIDRAFRFDQVKEAYTFMQSARHFGKIVITFLK